LVSTTLSSRGHCDDGLAFVASSAYGSSSSGMLDPIAFQHGLPEFSFSPMYV
jgi:hypothetical protein